MIYILCLRIIQWFSLLQITLKIQKLQSFAIKYNKPIRSSTFNFNKIVTEMNIDSYTQDSWDCKKILIIYIPLQGMWLQVT